MDITFITGNPGKLKAIQKFLDIPITHRSLDLEEIQSLDLETIVKDKALRAYQIVGKPVLIEDVSFVFPALGALPGPLIKWFFEELGNEGLCRLLDGKKRDCVATVCYGLYGGKAMRLFEGSMSGTISDSPRGSNSFGWGPIYIPAGHTKTYAELSDEEQSPISMRNIALKKLREFLILEP